MRTILAIVVIVNISGCAGSRPMHCPGFRNEDIAQIPVHPRGETGKPGVKLDAPRDTPAPIPVEPQGPSATSPEVYNSPTLWQSFKSIHMSRPPASSAGKKGANGGK